MAKQTVYVVFYGADIHLRKLANQAVLGLTKNGLVEVRLRQFPAVRYTNCGNPELQSPSCLQDKCTAVFTIDDLKRGDAFLFGLPSNMGTMPQQVRGFWDYAAKNIKCGAMIGKIAGAFFTTATQSASHEISAQSFIATLFQFGLSYAPLGMSHPHLFCTDEVIGASIYGSGTVSSIHCARQPSCKELDLAHYQGETFAFIVSRTPIVTKRKSVCLSRLSRIFGVSRGNLI
ncbi:hypothetical protein BB561_002380 [Smittium simulii]|uniref:Flavodoxin-like domain-containing protein n=1 Tax=Smittium simulii TaxID=133385 RepID=A0A2T9YQQ2_9FUNG|nr:hypothetical protein BB561_002380 [Smittium simulii]